MKRRNPSAAVAAKHRRAFVTILSDGVSGHHAVVVFVGRSSAGRRRVEGAERAFAVARSMADDLLLRGLVEEVRLTFAVGRREQGIEIRRIGPSGGVSATPWAIGARPNPEGSARPPEAVQRAFRQGLDLYARGLGGEGLRPETVAWARRLARGEAITPEKARKMTAWFARHGASPGEVAARKRQAAELARGTLRGKAPALVAWLLWGGDPAVTWSRGLVESGWALEGVPMPRKRMVRGNPAKLERCVARVEQRLGAESKRADPRETTSRAWAICTASLQKSGYLRPGTRTVNTAARGAARRRNRRTKG